MKSFFQSFDIEVPKLRGEGKAHTLSKNNEIPTKENIQAVLKVCDLLEKAIILVGATSGLAAAEICNLKVSDFTKGKDTKTGITTLKLRREKVGFDFVTFLTPEATQAVQDYLDYRERIRDTRSKNTIKHLEKQRIHSESDALFIIRNVPDAYLKNYDDNIRKYDTPTLMKLYRRLSNQSGQSTPTGDWNLIRSHNFRKFYNSAMLNAGADSFFVEFTMGHTLDDTRAAYFRASPEKLKEIYLKYIPYLTIQKDADITESPDFKRMNDEVQKLKAENEKLKLDRYENEAIKKLKEDLEELRRAQKEDEELESIFSDIVAGEFSVLNQGEDWDEKYDRHYERMKTDAIYRKKFKEFEMPFIMETFVKDDQCEEVKKYNRKKQNERRKILDTENKLQKALIGTKTLADEL